MSKHESMNIVRKNIRLLKFMLSLLPFLPFCAASLENLHHNLRPCPWSVKWKVWKLVKREYADLGPILTAGCLAKQHEEQVGKERRRQILMAAGVWKRRGVEEVRVWRVSRARWSPTLRLAG